MGYYTYYTLDVMDKDQNNILTPELDNKLAYKMAEINSSYFGIPTSRLSFQIAGEPIKWYEYASDMRALSKEFPEYLFLIHGEGEEPDDLWNHYFLNGQDQHCPAEIYYPPCTLV